MRTTRSQVKAPPDPVYPYTRKRRGGWQAVITVNGRRTYGPRRDDRKAAYEDALMLKARVDGSTAEDIEVLAAIKKFVAYHKEESREGTARFYLQKLSDWMEFAGPRSPLWSIHGYDLERFFEKRRDEGAARSLKAYRRALSAFFSWCRSEGLIEKQKDPLREIPELRLRSLTKARQDRYPWLPEDIIQRICDLIEQSVGRWQHPQWQADVVRLLYLTGLRRAESCRLKVEHVDFVEGVIYVDGKREGKHDKLQMVPITEELTPILERLIAHTKRRTARNRSRGYLIYSKAESMSEHFRRVRAFLKEEHKDEFKGVRIEDLKPHALRHSLGTNLIRQGVALAQVQMLLRHATPTMTSRYVHASTPDLRQSAARASLRQGPPSDEAPSEAPAAEGP